MKPIIIKLLSRIEYLSTNNDIIFCGIPSDIVIKGNDMAYSTAKKASTSKDSPRFPTLISDQPFIK